MTKKTPEDPKTETKTKRKHNPLQWVVVLPSEASVELPAAVANLIDASSMPVKIAVGPEFEGVPDARKWLLENGLVDTGFDLHRITERDQGVEQKRSIVQRAR